MQHLSSLCELLATMLEGLGAEVSHCLGVQQTSGAAQSPPTMHEGKEAVGGMGREVSDGTGCCLAAALVGEAAKIVGRHPSSSHVFPQHCVLTVKVRWNVRAFSTMFLSALFDNQQQNANRLEAFHPLHLGTICDQ